jgi:hypothetical protein
MPDTKRPAKITQKGIKKRLSKKGLNPTPKSKPKKEFLMSAKKTFKPLKPLRVGVRALKKLRKKK